MWGWWGFTCFEKILPIFSCFILLQLLGFIFPQYILDFLILWSCDIDWSNFFLSLISLGLYSVKISFGSSVVEWLCFSLYWPSLSEYSKCWRHKGNYMSLWLFYHRPMWLDGREHSISLTISQVRVATPRRYF